MQAGAASRLQWRRQRLCPCAEGGNARGTATLPALLHLRAYFHCRGLGPHQQRRQLRRPVSAVPAASVEHGYLGKTPRIGSATAQ